MRRDMYVAGIACFAVLRPALVVVASIVSLYRKYAIFHDESSFELPMWFPVLCHHSSASFGLISTATLNQTYLARLGRVAFETGQ